MSLVRLVVVGDWVWNNRRMELWEVKYQEQADRINNFNHEAYTIFQKPVPVPPAQKCWVRVFINKHNKEIKPGEGTFHSYSEANDAMWNKGVYDRFAIVEVTEGQGLTKP